MKSRYDVLIDEVQKATMAKRAHHDERAERFAATESAYAAGFEAGAKAAAELAKPMLQNIPVDEPDPERGRPA